MEKTVIDRTEEVAKLENVHTLPAPGSQGHADKFSIQTSSLLSSSTLH